jgi:hypothetical protein
MTDTELVIEAIKLNIFDGRCAAQVLVYNDAELEYWKSEAERTNHKLVFSYHVPENFYGYHIPHDVYQILPIGGE